MRLSVDEIVSLCVEVNYKWIPLATNIACVRQAYVEPMPELRPKQVSSSSLYLITWSSIILTVASPLALLAQLTG